MKRVAALLTAAVFLFCAACSAKEVPKADNAQNSAVVYPEMHGVWLSCYELQPMFAEGTKEAFEKAATAMTEKCVAGDINTLFVQLRPFCDELYPSEIFGWSDYALSADGKAPDYDPLEIILTLAHDRGIDVHAWINPYRVTYSTDFSTLSPACPAVSDEYRGCTAVAENGIYFDPSSPKAQHLVLDGIREILQKYDVDGIHIDDYFYPTTSADFDAVQFAQYCALGGEMSLDDWRRDNVNKLVAGIYALVKSADPAKVFSISPTADIEKNRTQYYADAALWCSSGGYTDMIIPQIYFGFEHETMPFEQLALSWARLVTSDTVRLVCGLAAYKQGTADEFAGTGKDEWVNNSGVISAQIASLSAITDYSGYVLFSFGYAL